MHKRGIIRTYIVKRQGKFNHLRLSKLMNLPSLFPRIPRLLAALGDIVWEEAAQFRATLRPEACAVIRYFAENMFKRVLFAYKSCVSLALFSLKAYNKRKDLEKEGA